MSAQGVGCLPGESESWLTIDNNLVPNVLVPLGVGGGEGMESNCCSEEILTPYLRTYRFLEEGINSEPGKWASFFWCPPTIRAEPLAAPLGGHDRLPPSGLG